MQHQETKAAFVLLSHAHTCNSVQVFVRSGETLRVIGRSGRMGVSAAIEEF
jgi:predicted RNA-binding protein YlqC (UPF0109 family)